MLRFDGRVAVVTGAGRGLGRAYAKALAERGAAVAVNDLGATLDGVSVEDSPARIVADEVTTAGGRAVPNGADISTEDGAASLVNDALEAFGRVDIVVNNAGILRRSDFSETTRGELDAHLAVHVAGCFNVTQAAWPHMVEQGYGRVVAAFSTAIFGIPGVLAYTCAKGGILGLMKGLAAEGEAHGIKANMVAPIAFTRMTPTDQLSEEMVRERQVAMAPEKVAELVVVLASEECPTTSEIYFGASDTVARIFLAQTVGYSKPSMTAEDILLNWTAVNEETNYTVPGPARLGQGFQQAAGAR